MPLCLTLEDNWLVRLWNKLDKAKEVIFEKRVSDRTSEDEKQASVQQTRRLFQQKTK